MRFVPIAFLLLLVACVTTSGTYDSSNRVQEPCIFTFAGSSAQVTGLLKRSLVREAFDITTDDTLNGILSTGFRGLKDDETYKVSMFGVPSASNAVGSLRFLVDSKPDTCVVTMQTLLMVPSVDQERIIAPQGHPLVMKWKKLLLAENRFKDVTPSAKRKK